jgi:hypothetical protein
MDFLSGLWSAVKNDVVIFVNITANYKNKITV